MSFMDGFLRKVILALLWICSTAWGLSPSLSEVNSLSIQADDQVKAALIPCTGMIDDGLYQSIKRRSETAISQGAQYLIFEIQTYGGLVQSADDISKYLILDIGKKVNTVAYVTTEAISAGAMISVSCQDIIMLENTTIGDCAPIVMGDKLEGVEREKAESFIRATFKRAAQANGYPFPLLKAMVSIQTEVYRIKNLSTEEYQYFESDQLPDDANVYDIDNAELVARDDELLTLTASEANEYGIARAVVDDLDEATAFLEKRDNVTFETDIIKLETNWSEDMVRFLNSPAMMGILIMIGLLGIYVEFNTPGLGLPGLVGIICFAIIIGSKYLVGMANWIEVVLFVAGLILLAIEIFVIPGFGIAGISGIVCVLAGLFGMLVKNSPDEIPWPKNELDWKIFSDGVLGLGAGFFAFLILAYFLAKYLPKFRFASGLILSPATGPAQNQIDVSATSAPDKEQKVKIGDIGEVVMKLRPAGKAKFGDNLVDVVCQADFIDTDQKVEIMDIHGNRVIVRKLPNEQ